MARVLAARPPTFEKLVRLAAGPVSLSVVGTRPSIDPHASLAEIRVDGTSILVAAPSRPIRELAQRWLGGPEELDAPRPLTSAEHGIWCLVVAAAIADFAIDAQVWPAFDKPLPALPTSDQSTIVGHAHARSADAFSPTLPGAPAASDHVAIELDVLLGNVIMSVAAFVPPHIELRVPPTRTPAAWTFDIPVVVGRAAVPREAIAALAVRDIVTIERTLELEIGDGRVGLTATPRAVEATVATGYIRRDMALPDDAHLELTVQLGTTRMSLRALAELAVGQIVSLGRPLAGPFEVRAGGRLVGQGELVDIDGELGVRIVSLAQE
ncbi:MAG: FliM/FliN family flagellar motor C-terminal domain-containing protein [Myxococcota bacterium]|nr:FliM/FliN family flagellar motor switch protein [Deltaproteobacteria bacterium]MDQ3341260.1 FliM/FliN family flagellar motor C-terminal domain-containing protein [Myxococcota bacterium]